MPILQHLCCIFRNTPTFSLSDGFQRSYGHVNKDHPFFWSTLYILWLLIHFYILDTYLIYDKSARISFWSASGEVTRVTMFLLWQFLRCWLQLAGGGTRRTRHQKWNYSWAIQNRAEPSSEQSPVIEQATHTISLVTPASPPQLLGGKK